MTGVTVACVNCGRPIDPEGLGVWQRVQAWEEVVTRRASGKMRSRSDVVLRERRQVWSCAPCIRRLQAGVSPQQTGLDV